MVGVSIVEGDLIYSPDCWNAYLTVLLRHLAPTEVYKVPKKMQWNKIVSSWENLQYLRILHSFISL